MFKTELRVQYFNTCSYRPDLTAEARLSGIRSRPFGFAVRFSSRSQSPPFVVWSKVVVRLEEKYLTPTI